MSENTNNNVKISGVYTSTANHNQAHTPGRLTMDTTTIRERLYEQTAAGEITQVDMKAIETYLNKVDYRREYNRRPEVRAKRKEYMKERNEKAKVGRQLLNSLLKSE